jgi:DNA-binding transcriptional MerR regulator
MKGIKILIMSIIWTLMSVSSFSQTTSRVEYAPKLIQDSTGVTFFAFDSLQTTELIKGLKDVGWSKKQIKALEKQLRNVKWKSKKQGEKIIELERQVQYYIEVEMNLKGQVEVKQKKIEELKRNIEDLETINKNLTTIKEQYEAKIKKLKWHKTVLIGTNVLTAILLALALAGG